MVWAAEALNLRQSPPLDDVEDAGDGVDGGASTNAGEDAGEV